jgi:hypothetical protein
MMANAVAGRTNSQFRSFELILGCLLLGTMVSLILASRFLFPDGGTTMDLAARLTRPFVEGRHFLGTDPIGRDVLARIAVGGEGATSGHATTSAGRPVATTVYRITGLTRDELQSHLGHRVEVKGQLSENVPPKTTATTTQDPATGRVTTAVKEDWTVAGALRATAPTMVAETCDP